MVTPPFGFSPCVLCVCFVCCLCLVCLCFLFFFFFFFFLVVCFCLANTFWTHNFFVTSSALPLPQCVVVSGCFLSPSFFFVAAYSHHMQALKTCASAFPAFFDRPGPFPQICQIFSWLFTPPFTASPQVFRLHAPRFSPCLNRCRCLVHFSPPPPSP